MNESEYEKAVVLIEQVEGGAVKPDVNFVDVSTTFTQVPPSRPKGYKELVVMIDEIEGRSKNFRDTLKPPDHSHLITSGISQVKFAQPQQPVPSSMPQPPVQRNQQIPDALQKQKEKVMSELSAITQKMSSIGPMIKQIRRQKVEVKDLILPNLSISDQISELERIIEGLKENVFDAEHIGIVTQEVYGLQQVVSQEKRKMKDKKQDSLEKSLWDLRDQRLDDAVHLLSKSGAS